MENGDGTDDTRNSVQRTPVAKQGSNVGPNIIVQTGSDSAGSTSVLDQAVSGSGATSEWNTYIAAQVRCNWDDMSDQDMAFCDEYITNGYKHRAAAIEVGYNPDRAIRLVRMPLLREYICHYEDQRRARSLVSEQFLDAKLMELYDQATGEVEIPIVTGAGDSIDAKKFDGNLALAILKERGTISGVTKGDEGKASGGVSITIDVGSLLGRPMKEVNPA